VIDATQTDMNSSRRVHRRDHIYSLDRGKRYTVLLRRLFTWLNDEEMMVLGYLLSLAKLEHPSQNDMITDLAMSDDLLKRALASLKAKGVVFHDLVPVGSRRKSLWHIAHPCRWSGSDIPLVESIDPFAHQPRTFSEPVARINEARDFILSQSDTFRVPNLLFRIHIGWRTRYVWAWLSQLPDHVNPSISELMLRLRLNYRTIRHSLDTLDDAGMIIIEEHHRRKFGGWSRLYFHLTDLNDWKFKAARDDYPAPEKRSIREVGRYSVEGGWHDRRDSYELQSQSTQYQKACEIEDSSQGSAFYSQRSYFRSAESGQDLHFGYAFSDGTSALQPEMTSFEHCMIAKMPSIMPSKPLADNPSSSYNKAYIIKAIEESREEGIARACEPLDARVRIVSEPGKMPVPLSRIISIADSVTHVFVNNRNRKCDPALWTDTVIDVYKATGEPGARKFARFVAEVFMARGRRPIAFNSLAVEDLATAFLSGKSAAELAGSGTWAVAMQEAVLDAARLSHSSDSSGMPASGAHDLKAPDAEGSVSFVEAAPDSEAHDCRPGAKPKADRLRDLPSDENRQRWLVIRIWPTLIKSQKAALQALWSNSAGPEHAIRAFAARDEDSHMKVISTAAELLKAGILAEAPPMPWDVVPSARAMKPNVRDVPKQDSGASVLGPVRANPPASKLEPPRTRLELAITTLIREYKPATRLSMEKGFSRLGHGDLWRALCGTFTEERVREVLDAIP
jgi:DNA-binding transcriptional ArsR family regulator